MPNCSSKHKWTQTKLVIQIRNYTFDAHCPLFPLFLTALHTVSSADIESVDNKKRFLVLNVQTDADDMIDRIKIIFVTFIWVSRL